MQKLIKKVKYLMEFFVFIIFFILFRIFPLHISRKIGVVISSFLGTYSPTNKIIKKNLLIAFPEKSKYWHSETIKKVWKNFGMITAEYAHLNKISKKENKMIEISSNQYAKDFFNSTNKNILVSAHSCNWEIPGIACKNHSENISGIVREPNNYYIKYFLREIRRKYSVRCYEKNLIGTKKLINDFNRGKSIALLADQQLSSGVETTFFGETVHSTSLPAQLALKSNCNIYLAWPRRDGEKFIFEFFPPIEVKQLENNQENIKLIVEKINRFFESQISKYPEEYFWHHNRWKTYSV